MKYLLGTLTNLTTLQPCQPQRLPEISPPPFPLVFPPHTTRVNPLSSEQFVSTPIPPSIPLFLYNTG